MINTPMQIHFLDEIVNTMLKKILLFFFFQLFILYNL